MDIVNVIVVGVLIYLITIYMGRKNKKNISAKIKQIQIVIFYILIISVIIIDVKFFENKNLESLGLTNINLNIQILIGVIGMIIMVMILFIPLIFGAPKNKMLTYKPKNIETLLFFFLNDMILVGFGEEIVFRGFFLTRLISISENKIISILIASILFGIWHYPINRRKDQVIHASLIGMIFALEIVYIPNCTIISTWIMHGINDAVIVLMSYLLIKK